MRSALLGFVAVCLVGLVAGNVSAQSNYRRPSNRPFDNILRSPSVSPYLNLINQSGDPSTPGGFNSGVARYQNFVRPQIDSRNRNARTQSQIRGLQNQVQQISTTAVGGMSTTTQMGFQGQSIPTGHPSVFQYNSHFYPALNRR